MLAKAIDERQLNLREKQKAESIIELEKRQLILFKNLKFKNFLIALTAQCLESMLSTKVDINYISFSSNTANRDNHSITELIALWLPIVSIVLAYTEVTIHTTKRDVSEILSEEDSLERISQQVSIMIYATQSTSPTPALQSFSKYIDPLG